MKISVTQEDILKGERSNCFLCPVSLAMTRAVGEPVEVNATFADWGKEGANGPDGHGQRLYFPEQVRFVICRYDMLGSMDPFEFELT